MMIVPGNVCELRPRQCRELQFAAAMYEPLLRVLPWIRERGFTPWIPGWAGGHAPAPRLREAGRRWSR